jgi:UDPglucose 6-dehydrogenase
MRDAVSQDVIEGLLEKGARVRAYDPAAAEAAKKLMPHLKICDSPYETAQGAHCLVILTEWNEFKELDLGKIKAAMKTPSIVDGRNIYDPEKARKLGFSYRGIGRA